MPEDITTVIISRGHPDHIGSCGSNGTPAFKNAEYYMPPEELEFWAQKTGADEDFLQFMLSVGNAQLEPVRQLIAITVYFFKFSTWLGKNGLYLEDLYVSPNHRGTGV